MRRTPKLDNENDDGDVELDDFAASIVMAAQHLLSMSDDELDDRPMTSLLP